EKVDMDPGQQSDANSPTHCRDFHGNVSDLACSETERADAKRREQRHQTAQLVARTYLQIEEAASTIATVARDSTDVVRVSHRGGEWIVTGRGPDYRVRDAATAEREAKRRAGWTR